MVNYHNSKIYKIWSSNTEKIYIGSTTQKLCVRLVEHKSKFKKYKNETSKYYTSSFELLKYDDAKIELIEEYKCDNKEQLYKREGEIIRQNKDLCVNMLVAGRSYTEYRLNNKDKINERSKIYRRTHKEKINLYASQPYKCACGLCIRYDSKGKHFQSITHNRFLQDNFFHLLELK
jgi:hypothetical protein